MTVWPPLHTEFCVISTGKETKNHRDMKGAANPSVQLGVSRGVRCQGGRQPPREDTGQLLPRKARETDLCGQSPSNANMLFWDSATEQETALGSADTTTFWTYWDGAAFTARGIGGTLACPVAAPGVSAEPYSILSQLRGTACTFQFNMRPALSWPE